MQPDFATFLAESGWTDEQVHEDMALAGYIPEEEHEPEVLIAKSPIHGNGCFSMDSYRPGDRVCIVRFRDRKTAEGRFINHSANPNVEFVVVGEETHAYAIAKIAHGDEIVVNYRQSLALALKLSSGTLEIADEDTEARAKSSCIAVEKLESWLSIMPQKPETLNHVFTEGLYSRQSIIGPGCIFITETHKKDHQFAFTTGEAYVWSKETGWREFVAPMTGVTKAGTRRVVITKTECVMTTFHPNPANIANLDDIWDSLYVRRAPPRHLMSGDIEEIQRFMGAAARVLSGQDGLEAISHWGHNLNLT